MARNCVRDCACMLFATAALLTGCGGGSRSMVNAVSPNTTARISAKSYDFGQNIVGSPETQTVVEVTNTGANQLTLNPTIVGSNPDFTVVAAQSCGTTLAAASSCPIVITFAPAAAGTQSAVLNLGLSNVPLPLAPGLVTLTGTSTVVTTTTASLSATSHDFGQNIVGNSETQTVVEVTNTGNNQLKLNPTVTGSTGGFTVVSAQSCGTTLAAASSCPIVITYAPTTAGPQTATLNLGLSNVPAATPPALVALTGTSAVMTAGTVAATSNPQVALYTITPPFAGTVTVNFGPTTSYGKQTWSVPAPSGGGPVSIEVAGMSGNTAYHLQAAITLADGVTAADVDHTFTTGSYPGNLIPQIAAAATAGQTPQPGIEIANPVGASAHIVATDLSGNIIWAYAAPDPPSQAQLLAPKLLPNGDFIYLYSDDSSAPINGGFHPGDPNVVREVDLIGNTVKQITMTQLNTRLAAANYNLTLDVFSHDVTPLQNGHWLVVANTVESVVLNGQTTPTNVLGDVIVDLDTNLNPVWVWNEFDHFDVNRHPALFTSTFGDWTHTNAVIYSKDDGNLLVSMRHQSWVVKVDYNNGTGSGNVLWRLGYQGDFKLIGGTDPTDWFYGQHGPHFTTSNTTGIFGLTLMDNGNFRIFPAGVTCGTGSAPPCHYSTIPIFQIDEAAKTATLTFHQILPTPLYSQWGGNSHMLKNGNLEYDLCGLMPEQSQVFEVTPESTPQTVWNLTLNSNAAYRVYRLPSLYPGVQW